MAEKIVMTNSNEATSAIFGSFDVNVRMVEEAFDVRISNRNAESDHGDAIVVKGEADGVNMAARVLEYLKMMSGSGETLSEQSVEYVIGLVSIILLTLLLRSASTAIATARNVLPVPAGPRPNITVFFFMDSMYFR